MPNMTTTPQEEDTGQVTTLQDIGYVLIVNSSITVVSFIFFYFAVRTRSVNIAPRSAARSPNTIYNPVATRGKKKEESKKEKYNDEDDGSVACNYDDDASKYHVQFRGGPMFGWIPWTLNMSYEKMLKGIPGTGTRNNGMAGKMLNLNLDDIVFLRFHGKFIFTTFLLDQLLDLPYCYHYMTDAKS